MAMADRNARSVMGTKKCVMARWTLFNLADIAKKLKNHIAVTPEIFDSVSGRFLNCSFFSNFSRKDKQSFRTKICNCINIESMHNRNI